MRKTFFDSGWMDGRGKPSHRRASLHRLPRSGPDQSHSRGMSSSPVRMEPDVNPEDEKHYRKREEFESSPTSFKPLCPARPSPSFVELPGAQWRPSAALPYNQTARIGKGKRHFSPDHQPQECFGLLECMHNNIQMQTQIAQTQLSLLEDMRESLNLLLSRQGFQSSVRSTELVGPPEQRTPRASSSSPHPLT